MLSFFQREVLDEIRDLIESVYEGFPTYLGTHFDVTKHIRLVPSFQGKEVDKYFLHFVKAVENLK